MWLLLTPKKQQWQKTLFSKNSFKSLKVFLNFFFNIILLSFALNTNFLFCLISLRSANVNTNTITEREVYLVKHHLSSSSPVLSLLPSKFPGRELAPPTSSMCIRSDLWQLDIPRCFISASCSNSKGGKCGLQSTVLQVWTHKAVPVAVSVTLVSLEWPLTLDHCSCRGHDKN